MKSKRQNENSQLSLTLELPSARQDSKASAPASVAELTPVAKIFAFPIQQPSTQSFRERVIQDLIRNRVMVD